MPFLGLETSVTMPVANPVRWTVTLAIGITALCCLASVVDGA